MGILKLFGLQNDCRIHKLQIKFYEDILNQICDVLIELPNGAVVVNNLRILMDKIKNLEYGE